ncbi:TetR/AcrR family transcriptional regulator [Desulfomonile tiedjei]|uniref:Transcriptional regulator n=1 Tax=Desulfomonile tiedjei (strain ATCC 49306 / DSM 6799 / DCB-1) TaxID=706587 RepID=I4C1D5_DESTA|nr:TetR/AcrR family transcriptional regulator [Desulfomonile tiedjei]AFM23376.1 transcriptional regulator [Desulfomonile tiedjei DSM 6799]
MKETITRREKSASRRREIIQAGLACFTERGFTETSMAEIRRRSGASTGSIYHHFKSKEQLAAAIYLEGIRDYQTRFLASLEEQTEAREGIFAVIRYHLRWVEEHPDWTRYLFRQRHAGFMAETEEEFARMNQIFFQRCADWFRRHVKAGTLRQLPPDLYGSLLLGPCMEFTRQYLAGHTRTSPDQAIQELASAAWRCLSSDTDLRSR